MEKPPALSSPCAVCAWPLRSNVVGAVWLWIWIVVLVETALSPPIWISPLYIVVKTALKSLLAWLKMIVPAVLRLRTKP